MFNELLSNLIALRYIAKNAHWGCSGFLFYQFHKLFDRIYKEYEDIIDRLAEAIRSDGIKVLGNVNQVAALSTLGDQLDSPSALELAQDLLDKINKVIVQNDEIAAAIQDQAILNILADLAELLKNHKYLLESSLA